MTIDQLLAPGCARSATRLTFHGTGYRSTGLWRMASFDIMHMQDAHAECIRVCDRGKNVKSKGIRLWTGQQQKGVVRNGNWLGAEPLWNIGIWLRSGDVKDGLKISEVLAAVEKMLKQEFPQYGLEISPKGREALAGKLDGMDSFHH